MRVHARRTQNRAAKVRCEPGAINNQGVSAVMKLDDASPAHFPNFSPIESAARGYSALLARPPIDISPEYRRIPGVN